VKPPSQTSSTSSSSTSPTGPLKVTEREELRSILTQAILSIEQPLPMDISAAGLSEQPELDVKNLFYEILRDMPELKYAYDLSVVQEEGLLSCFISYMPYKTGNFQQDFSGTEVSSLEELIEVAEKNLGEDPVPIQITNSTLEPDAMNYALLQCGGGYILCALDRDGTHLTYSPAPGMDIEECLSALKEADILAEQILDSQIQSNMTDMEKAEVLFSYVTETVKYDDRYYSDPNNMPYASRTSLGAIKEHMAICGGYANMVKLLFEKAGIPCNTVSGSYFGENHMWNIALINGQWLWCDATAGRGSSIKYGLRHFALESLDETQYTWDKQRVMDICCSYM